VPSTVSPSKGRRRIGGGAVVALAVLLLSTPVRAADALRVATYNIFGGNPDLERSIDIIRAADVDLVALQEISHRMIEVLDARLSGRFPYRYLPEPTHGGGVALLSRVPLTNERYRPSERGLNGFAFAEIELGGRRVQVASLHLDPIRAWTFAYVLTLPWQMLWQGSRHRRELAQVWAELSPAMATIILGDLNTNASMAAPRELSRWGLVDSYAAVHSNERRVATHRAEIFGISVARRIDYIFHSREFRTVDSERIPGEPSDHDMIRSTLEMSVQQPSER
jgi:endonuclease/exonuclease/phosphatase family metal-dependent hydrolase